ncbi:MAG: TetR/AcrR family transcriptional regulator [Coprococcus sp.]
MNTAVTSKEEILRVSRDFIQRQGWESINIRTIAKECNISVGSIYNYFQNKTDLITATVKSVWHDIFHFPENTAAFDSFVECVEWAFEYEKRGRRQKPRIFAFHSCFSMRRRKETGKRPWRYG